MTSRIFYAAGPGDIIRAHKHWELGERDPSQMALTFSGQFADFCRSIGAEAYMVSYFPKRDIYQSGKFLIEHAPKLTGSARGMKYHLLEIIYGVVLFVRAVRFRADIAVVHSGTTHNFVLFLFCLAGMKVIPVLHNTPWPKGSRPTKAMGRLILSLDSLLFRWGAHSIIGVSPECLRQVTAMIGRLSNHCLVEMRGQYIQNYFANIPPPSSYGTRPFLVLYCGRLTRDKGVFDLLKCAQEIQKRNPELVNWCICGDGPELHKLRHLCKTLGLEAIMTIRGFVGPSGLHGILARVHASIVPTRGEFAEGLALSAVESVLAGRPCITNQVVPALEVLRPACVEAQTDDVASYVDAVTRLATSPTLYHSLCECCAELSTPFYDRSWGFEVALTKAFVGSTGTTAGKY